MDTQSDLGPRCPHVPEDSLRMEHPTCSGNSSEAPVDSQESCIVKGLRSVDSAEIYE